MGEIMGTYATAKLVYGILLHDPQNEQVDTLLKLNPKHPMFEGVRSDSYDEDGEDGEDNSKIDWAIYDFLNKKAELANQCGIGYEDFGHHDFTGYMLIIKASQSEVDWDSTEVDYDKIADSIENWGYYLRKFLNDVGLEFLPEMIGLKLMARYA
jgi:hypothetical protein